MRVPTFLDVPSIQIASVLYLQNHHESWKKWTWRVRPDKANLLSTVVKYYLAAGGGYEIY